MKFTICVLLLSVYTSTAAGGEYTVDREFIDREIIKATAMSMFDLEQFRELDETARRYRESEERTDSGVWKLSFFYAGISRVADQNERDEDYWGKLEHKALRWIDTYPDSPSGYLVYADFLLQHAWMYRGTGLAREVRPEDWEPFRKYLAKAREFLNTNKKIASQDPRWYELMMMIAKAEQWSMGEFNDLVGEATKRAPYFYQIYFAAVDYFTPNWHGSKTAIEQFAQTAVALTREVEKTGMYARVYWYASQTYYDASLFAESAVVWEKMSVSIDDVLERYPNQWNINNFAFLACLARDADKTNALIGRIQGNPINSVWRGDPFFHKCKKWSASKVSEKER